MAYKPSNKQTINIAQMLKSMLKELELMATKTLLEIADDNEKNHLYVKIGPSKNEKEMIDLQLFNGATKTIAIKSYIMIDLLKECKDLFLVNAMVDSNMRKLYKRSKETVFKKNTEVWI